MAQTETQVQSLGWKDPLEKGMATHSSILAWRITWTEEPGGLQCTGSQSRTRQRDKHFHFHDGNNYTGSGLASDSLSPWDILPDRSLSLPGGLGPARE